MAYAQGIAAATLLSAGLIFTASGRAAERLVLEPSQDNTLYETLVDQDGELYEMSNGAGTSLFVGRTGLDAGYRLRRALLAFDLSTALPAGAEILHVEFSLKQTKAAPGSPPAEIGLYRVLNEWGEGASNALGPEGQGNLAQPGDATWHHRLHPDTLWDTAGGDFREAPSSSITIGRDLVSYTWLCSPGLLEDIRFWLENPEQNFGWILVGGEAAGFSAHRFASRENSEPDNRPRLHLIFRTADEIHADGFEPLSNCDQV